MSATPTSTFVIVGAGLAGAKAAETLRAEGFDGRLLLLGEEAERPYERPPLSKAYLRGEADRDSLYVHPEGFYAAHDIELRPSPRSARSTRQPPARARVGRADQLRATAAGHRRGTAPPALPGAELDGVRYLRTRGTPTAWRPPPPAPSGSWWWGPAGSAARPPPPSASSAGRSPWSARIPLARVLGPEVAAVYRDLHADHGVRLQLGTRVAGLRGNGRVEAVVTEDGRTIDCDLVLIGAGAVPRTELAEAAGLPVRNGVLVNEQLEAVGAAGVYAAGDVAAAWHPRYQTYLHVEHWANALNQGPAAARNMLGRSLPYARLPTSTPTSTTWAWSTRGWRRAGIGWWSAAIWLLARSSLSGSRTSGWWPA